MPDSGYDLEVESTRFAGELNTECETKRGVKDATQGVHLSHGKDGSTLCHFAEECKTRFERDSGVQFWGC